MEFNLTQFGYINGIDIYLCQSYFKVFKILFLLEEAFIVYAYPIITIIKLRLTGQNISTFYLLIYRHTKIIPQQPHQLLSLLPSNKLSIHNVIRVVWLKRKSHNEENLQYFYNIRKMKVLESLICLKDYNIFYKDITINFDLTDTWKREFIFAISLSQVL